MLLMRPVCRRKRHVVEIGGKDFNSFGSVDTA
jgi:hypothetical protein